MTHTAVDVGGTFTDVVSWDGTRLTTGKVPTTADQSVAVIEGIGRIAPGGTRLIHGTTAATNAVLQRAGARTALVTDAGFEDLIEIGRQDRPSLYDLAVSRPVPLAPGALRLGLAGRADAADGPSPSTAALTELCDRVAEADPEAIAVSLLFSFAHPDIEGDVGRALASRLPDVPVSLSSRVVAEFREFERASTTLLNAYLIPAVASYLDRLSRYATEAGVEGGVSVMRSSGGLISLADAAALPASIILSGPAGGAVAAAALGQALGLSTVVSFDMGGTSTDVCRIEGGRPEVGYERSIDGLPCRMPSVAIHTVGAGGGSLAWADEGGALRVGPQSAGAIPGPAAYGRGGAGATVTDADLALGRIGAESQLGGALTLDWRAAERVLAEVGSVVGLDPSSAARMLLIRACTSVGRLARSRRPISVPCWFVSPRSSSRTWNAPSAACRWSREPIRAVPPSSPLAEPVDCTPPPWRGGSTWPVSSCPRTPASSRHSGCCSPRPAPMSLAACSSNLVRTSLRRLSRSRSRHGASSRMPVPSGSSWTCGTEVSRTRPRSPTSRVMAGLHWRRGSTMPTACGTGSPVPAIRSSW